MSFPFLQKHLHVQRKTPRSRQYYIQEQLGQLCGPIFLVTRVLCNLSTKQSRHSQRRGDGHRSALWRRLAPSKIIRPSLRNGFSVPSCKVELDLFSIYNAQTVFRQNITMSTSFVVAPFEFVRTATMSALSCPTTGTGARYTNHLTTSLNCGPVHRATARSVLKNTAFAGMAGGRSSCPSHFLTCQSASNHAARPLSWLEAPRR